MELVDRDLFLPALRQQITGPLEITMGEAITTASIAFCRESGLLALDRTVAAPAAGSLLTVCDQEGMTACDLLYLTTAEDGDPLKSGSDYFAISPNQVSVLTDLPDVRLWYVASPALAATQLPAQLLADHADTICHGAAAILYAQPDRPWADPGRAKFHQAAFVEGYRDAGRFRRNHAAPTQTDFSNPVRSHSFI